MHKLRITDKIYLGIWSCALLLIPFYLLGHDQERHILTPVPTAFAPKVEGGVPQIADDVMLVLMVLVFCDLGFCFIRRTIPIIQAFAAFTTYAVMINLLWSYWLSDLYLIRNSLFYVFNFLVLVMFLVLYARCRETFLKVTVHALAASVILQALLSPFGQVEGWFRQKLFFNNENQLGYFALLATVVFSTGTKVFPIKTGYQACFYVAATYLAILSLSKAALIALAVLFFLLLLQRPLSSLAVLIVLAVAFTPILAPDIIDKLEMRMGTADDDETLEARGYDRMWNHPEYLIFGAGEGAYGRFNSQLASELHSSFGTLLFCYGLVGTLLFTCGLLFICSKLRSNALVLLFPVFLYGTAHHGLKFRLLWILLAFLSCLTKTPPRVPSQGERHGGFELAKGEAIPEARHREQQPGETGTNGE
jgi:hypothetical protein